MYTNLIQDMLDFPPHSRGLLCDGCCGQTQIHVDKVGLPVNQATWVGGNIYWFDGKVRPCCIVPVPQSARIPSCKCTIYGVVVFMRYGTGKQNTNLHTQHGRNKILFMQLCHFRNVMFYLNWVACSLCLKFNLNN